MIKNLRKKFNHFLYRFFWVNANKTHLKKPLCVDIELTSECNLKCPFCYHANEKTPFEKGFIDTGHALLILDEASKLCVPSIKLNWRGEPTLHKDFDIICKHAKELSTTNTFIERITNTNMFFNPNNEKIFKGLLAQNYIKISLDSLRHDTYEQMRVNSNFSIVMRNITKLMSLIDPKEHTVVIQFVRTKLNQDEDFNKALEMWPSAKISVREEVKNRVSQGFETSSEERQPCTQAFARIMIAHDLSMWACCPNYFNHNGTYLGSFDKTSLKEAFTGIKARSLRKALKDLSAFNNDPCKNCSSYESYIGSKPKWKA